MQQVAPTDQGPGSWAYVALGSNLGDPAAQLRRAAARLRELGTVMARSSLFATAPVGGPGGQGEYLNAVVALAVPGADPHQLLDGLLAIEREMGRVRGERWGPRSIDLDLLALGAVVVAGGEGVLQLPHPRLTERAFVLVPLCEIGSRRNETSRAWRHPVTGRDACTTLMTLAGTAQAVSGSSTPGVRRTDLRW